MGPVVPHSAEVVSPLPLPSMQGHDRLGDAALSALPSPVCVLDADGIIVRVNDAWDRACQREGEARARRLHVGASYLELCLGATALAPDAPAFADALQTMLRVRGGPLMRTGLLLRAGDVRRVLVQANGLPTGGAVVLHTDLGPAQSPAVVDMPREDEAVWLLDAAGRTTFVSRRGAALLGESPSTLLGRAAYLHLDHASVAAFHAGVQRWRQGVSDQLELRLRRGNGTPLWARVGVTPLTHADGVYAGIRLILEDISEQHEAEERLQAALDALQAVVAASPLAIVTTDVESRVERWNAAAARLFGWTETEAIGLQLPPVTDELRDEDRQLRGEALRGGLVTGRETERLARDGTPVQVSLSLAPLHHRDGRPRGLVMVFDDIGPRKQADVEVMRASRIQATAKLAGGVAHDVNNLMAGVLGNAELLRSDLADHPDVVPVLDDIASAAVRAGALAQQLLAYARGGRYRPEPIDLAPVVQAGIAEQARELAPRSPIREQIAADLWTIEADRAQMAQLVSHLVANAIEATREKGAIIVRAENVQLTEAWVGERPGASPGPHVRVSVSDTGLGMDRHTRDHAFEPFFTTKRGARGLGLAAAFGITKSHLGYVHLESRPGEGTLVEVYLPAVPELARAAAALPMDPLPRGRETILVVDDERSVRDVMRRLLERLGYIVDLAESGAEALDLVSASPSRYDLVILDLRMPVMRGPEVFRHLRVIRPGLRILVATGYERDDEAQRLLDEGAVGFLQKPFEQTRLAQALRRVLDAPSVRP